MGSQFKFSKMRLATCGQTSSQTIEFAKTVAIGCVIGTRVTIFVTKSWRRCDC